MIGYRIYRDLKRGWRVTSPNLEQCGLLKIKYVSLDELCRADEYWQGCHAALVEASPQTRENVATVLLDYLRRELAIDVDYLTHEFQERLLQQSSQRLRQPWAVDEQERPELATSVFPRARQATRTPLLLLPLGPERLRPVLEPEGGPARVREARSQAQRQGP